MSRYGFPYQGSKQAIADEIINNLPPADNFYDLFAGGGSIGHAAALSGKYKHVYMSDISGSINLFKRATDGEFNYDRFKPEFISRRQFFANLNDGYTKYIWSFGNNGSGYFIAKGGDHEAKMIHDAVVFGEVELVIKALESIKKYNPLLFSVFNKTSGIKNRRLAWSKYVRSVKGPESWRRLEQLERIERLQLLEGVGANVTVSQESYNKVKIEPGSIVYCDIPYNTASNSSSYTGDFNHKIFWMWSHRLRQPLYVSEYWAPEFMKEVWSKRKPTLMGSKNGKRVVKTEKLFWNQI